MLKLYQKVQKLTKIAFINFTMYDFTTEYSKINIRDV